MHKQFVEIVSFSCDICRILRNLHQPKSLLPEIFMIKIGTSVIFTEVDMQFLLYTFINLDLATTNATLLEDVDEYVNLCCS